MRINKFLSHSGFCSRREAENLLIQNRISIDNRIINQLSTKVNSNQIVRVDGKIVELSKKTRLWIYYKPRGLICSKRQQGYHETIFQKIQINQYIISIGRLDLDSEGLLLLTNNGDLARFCEMPLNSIERVYNVHIYGLLSYNEMKESLENGLYIDGVNYKPIKFYIIQSNGKKDNLVKLILREGKNREIRKIMRSFNIQVNKLKRISYGPFHLKNLNPGDIKEICSQNIIKNFPFLKC